jgi:hypothetical protein
MGPLDDLAVDGERSGGDGCIKLTHLDMSFGDADGWPSIEAGVNLLQSDPSEKWDRQLTIRQRKAEVGRKMGRWRRTSLNTVWT